MHIIDHYYKGEFYTKFNIEAYHHIGLHLYGVYYELRVVNLQ